MDKSNARPQLHFLEFQIVITPTKDYWATEALENIPLPITWGLLSLLPFFCNDDRFSFVTSALLYLFAISFICLLPSNHFQSLSFSPTPSLSLSSILTQSLSLSLSQSLSLFSLSSFMLFSFDFLLLFTLSLNFLLPSYRSLCLFGSVFVSHFVCLYGLCFHFSATMTSPVSWQIWPSKSAFTSFLFLVLFFIRLLHSYSNHSLCVSLPLFFDASSHLYKPVCPFIDPSICWSLRRSVRMSIMPMQK